MRNIIKNNSFASGLLGALLGAGSVLGIQTFTSNPDSITHEVTTERQSAFESVVDDPNGPYVITRHGGKFHDPGCRYLTSSPPSNIKHVSEDDANAAGYKSCSSCLKP